FPEKFRFQVTENDLKSLRFQIGTSNSRGGRRYLSYAFTEQGVAMFSTNTNYESFMFTYHKM
ncbi:MAG: ORF6N domain-containing protein, partial [Patescibacteria group bacterium]|nr:ORF6N domain-containing protein [Patescibacteria group bacterium]